MVTESEILSARRDDPKAFGGNQPDVRNEMNRQVEQVSEQGNSPIAIDTGTDLLRSEVPNVAPLEREPRPDVLAVTTRPDVLGPEVVAAEESRYSNTEMNKAQEDAIIAQSPDILEEQFMAAQAGVGTVNDELIQFLIDTHNDDSDMAATFVAGMRDLPPEQQTLAIEKEMLRRKTTDLPVRTMLLIQASRRGSGQLSSQTVTERHRELLPQEIQALQQQFVGTQNAQVNVALNELVAGIDIGTIPEGVGKAAIADFTPILPLLARVGVNNILLDTAGIDVPWYQAWLPGEQRQVLREGLSKLSPQEWIDFIGETQEAIQAMLKGKKGKVQNEYLVLEAIMETFTPEIIDEANPQNTVDRWMGNFDAAIELVYGVSVLAKIGTRSVRMIHRTNDANKSRGAAKTAGNHEAVNAHDQAMIEVAERYDVSPAEAAANQYPKPPTMIDNREVLTDTTVKVLEDSNKIESRILAAANEGVGHTLRIEDKANAIRQDQKFLEEATGFRSHPKMSVLEELEDGAGITVHTVLGGPNGGYKDLRAMLTELAEYDPNLATVRVMRRNKAGELEDMMFTPDEFAKTVVTGEIPLRHQKSGGPADALHQVDGDEYFIQIKQDRFWHPTDKIGFNTESISSTIGPVTNDVVLPPNRIFGGDIYDAVARADLTDSYIRSNFNQLYAPYTKLSSDSKINISHVMESGEDFARSEGRAMTLSEIIDRFPNLTTPELDGIVALRRGLDVQWSLFNRRLYRELSSRGMITVRPQKGKGARYHGKRVLREEVNRKGTGALDPITGKIEHMDPNAVDDLYNGGGGFLRSDIEVDVAAGGKADLVIVRAGDYDFGKLSRQPLDYHAGYYPRFYKDPYHIVKVSPTRKINGRTERLREPTEEAVATASHSAKAERQAAYMTENSKHGNTYKPVRVAQLDRTLGSLYQQQALQREGRLFWDVRNHQRLRDASGNLSELQDPIQALERNMRIATRQITHEEIIGSMKNGFAAEFPHLVKKSDIANRSARDIVTDLRSKKNNAVTTLEKAQYRKAIRLAKYIRRMEGTDEVIVPAMRGLLNDWAAGIGRVIDSTRYGQNFTDSKPFLRNIENWTARMSPFTFLRSQAFRAYMVLRPGRQAALQSTQITFLTGIDPVYISTGTVFRDMLYLRRGFNKIRNLGVTDAMSDAKAAKAMGISKAEYHVLTREFEKSGLMDSVNDHAFKGATGSRSRVPTNAKALPGFRRRKQQVVDSLEEYGFDWGEQNNLTGTYMVSTRKYMRNNKVTKMTDISKKGWEAIKIDTSNMALAMIKANSMPYQSGIWGVATQFLSFSHKAMLGYAGQAAGLRGRHLALVAGSWGYWGANLFGAEEFVRTQLEKLGAEEWMEREVPGGGTILDILVQGMVETVVDGVANVMSDDQELIHLEGESFAPGINAIRIYESLIETTINDPAKGFAGPSGSLIGAWRDTYENLRLLVPQDHLHPVDKFTIVANEFLKGYYPQYNDLNMAWVGHRMGQWYTRSGEPTAIATTWESLVARALFGGRTEEELHLYDLNNRIFEDKQNYKDIVRTNQRFLTKMYGLYWNGEVNQEQFSKAMLSLAYMSEAFGEEGQKHQLIIDSVMAPGENGEPSVSKLIADHIVSGKASVNFDQYLDYFPDMPSELREELRTIYQNQQHQLIRNDKLIIDKVKEENQ